MAEPATEQPEQEESPWFLWGRIIGTIAAGFAGGWVARFLGVPLPWLLGPLFVTAALGLFGVPIRAFRRGRNFGQVVVGASTGLQFSQAILLQLLLISPLIVLATAASTLIGAIGALMLMRLTKLDRTTAFFATTSGGVVEMANIAAKYNAQLEPIAVVHTMRVAFIVTVAPLVVIHFSNGAAAAAAAPAIIVPWLPFLGLIAIAGVIGYLAAYREIPNAWFLSAMLIGACVAMFGFAQGRAPDALLVVAQVMMGTSLGAQFRREFLGRLLPIMAAGTVVVAFTTSANAAIGVGLAYLLGLPVATMVLAMAPGGMAEMVVTAKLIGADATLVTGFQLLRIILVLAWCDPAYKLLERFTGNRA
jgi:membrane AbrB-like protein